MTSTGFRIFMAYPLELNISHNIKKVPKTSCLMVYIGRSMICLFIGMDKNQLLQIFLFML